MAKKPLNVDPLANEFGWPLPRRKQHFEDVKGGAAEQRKIEFQDAFITLPVLRVPINLPKYRMMNGRTESAQQEWLATHPGKPENFFRQDPESDEAQRVQHELLGKLVNDAGLLTYFKKVENKQKEPLILDCNGFVINGKRRLCAWRTLHKQDAAAYGHFSHLDVMVLPPADEQAIDKLEGTLQVEPDIRADYTWDSLANMMRARQSLHGMDTKDLATFYRRKEAEVRELLDMLDYADKYLEKRGKRHQWSEVSKKQYAFREMVKKRDAFANAGEKQLFQSVAFVLIDDPDDGRVYEAIPDAQKNFASVRTALSQAFPVTPEAGEASLDLLGGTNEPAIDLALAQEIEKDKASRERAATIVRDVIEMIKLVEKEKKSSDYLVNQLQKANSLVQSAISGGLRPGTRTDGVDHQLTSIEDGVAQIRQWLKANA